MKKIIKTGMLAFGMSGKLFHAPFLSEHSGFELHSVVERTNKKAHLIYPKIKSYDSVKELLEDPDIELVVINTPNATHFEFALQAIQERKHVVIEKPFTVTSMEAKQLYEEAKRYNCFIFPFQNRRYDSDYLAVKKVLESERLGRLTEVHFRYDRYQYELSSNVSKEEAIKGNGLLYSLGPHVLDAAISLFGTPIKWTKTVEGFRPNTQIDDYAHIHLTYPKGLQVFLTASLLVAEAQPAFILNGTRGSFIKQRADIQEKQLQDGMKINDPLYGIEELDKKGVLTLLTDEGKKVYEEITSDPSNYLNLFENIYQTISEGKPYPIRKKEIMQQLEILET